MQGGAGTSCQKQQLHANEAGRLLFKSGSVPLSALLVRWSLELLVPSRDNLESLNLKKKKVFMCWLQGKKMLLQLKPDLGKEQTDHLASFLSRKRKKGRQRKKRRRENMRST